MSDYATFIAKKSQIGKNSGFEPNFMPEFLFDFQRSLVEWAIRKGRAAIFADCGLGKTPMQLVWAENVARHTDKPVLIVTPIAVGSQTVSEAAKFGIEADVSRDGVVGSRIVVTNYERLHYFDSSKFGGVVCDESSIIKNASGKTRKVVTEFLSQHRYRLLCTATAAPNDWHELGTSSEALGELGWRDMITMFFKQETTNDFRGWSRVKYRFREHAKKHFWRWVCSWSRAIRRPSDIGGSDDRFILPPLETEEQLVKRRNRKAGFLFDLPAHGMEEQREERKATIQERCERVAENVRGSEPAVIWCHLIDEGRLLKKLIDDSIEVSGSDDDERKEAKLQAFSTGNARVLIIKPKIGAWGLNWQHCSNVEMFPSHSYEQYYQAVRRCYRFGQKNRVRVRIVTTEGEQGVQKNLQRKAAQADEMFSSLVAEMNNAVRIDNDELFPEQERLPSWL